MSNSTQHTLPAVHAGHLVELVRRFGVTAEALLQPLGISPQVVAEPHERLTIPQLEALVERARSLTGEPGLGIYLGLSMRVSWHGHLGFAAMTAGTLREALDLAIRFLPTRSTAIGLRLHEENSLATLVLDENVELGRAREALVFFLLVGIAHTSAALIDRPPADRALLHEALVMHLAFPEPAYFVRFRDAVKMETRFGQPQHQLVFDASVLDLPLKMADPAALRLATEQCERELSKLGFEGDVAHRVRALLGREATGFPTLEEVAKQLHLSPRTLKRRLAEVDTSYSQLLEDERRERAVLLLGYGNLSIEDIAGRLGYADTAAFTHAFTRWTGKPPSVFRKRV